ncbi:MAG: GNAT family N-acetyltransferase [Pseudorhodobacter sp.]|nr:GNAT family N-acetyltransferase [Pseudorhodobacter sp.]
MKRGIYTVRSAKGSADTAATMTLRQTCFRAGSTTPDDDRFDTACQHMLVMTGDTLVASCRTQTFADPGSLPTGYTAQFYDLTPLQTMPGPMIELGRFCLHPDHADPDIVRLAWGALTQMVDQTQAQLLFGCSSFPGADAHVHSAPLGYLAQRHLGPDALRPGKRAAETIDLRSLPPPAQPPTLPPLLKTYLAMGGWVSDHAVPDRDLNTTHVFAALEIARIPAARARALRALSG